MKTANNSYKLEIESVFRAAPIGIGVVVNRVITEVNQHFCKLVGYSSAELLGENSRMLYLSDADYEYVGRVKYRQIQESGIGRVETRFRCKDGHCIDILLSSSPIDPENLARGVTFTVMDITQQKRAEQEREEYIHFFEHLEELTNSALQMLSLDEMLRTLANRMGELIGADGCYITLWDESTHSTIPAAAYGPLHETYAQFEILADEPTMTRSVLQAGHAIVAEDVYHSPYISARIASFFPAISMLGLPLIVEKRKLGAALLSFNQPHHFLPLEIARCEQAAAQIALAIDKTRLAELAQQQAAVLQEIADQKSRDLDIVMGCTVNREVRMGELKKVISKLRAQLIAAGMTPVANDPLLENPATFQR